MTIEYWKKLWYSVSIALREKFANMELFLVRIFLYSDWIQENTAQKKIRIRTLFTQCWKQLWRYSLKHHVTIHLNLNIPILLHGVHKTPENNKAFLKPENVKDQSSSRFVNFLKFFFEKLTFLTPDAYTRVRKRVGGKKCCCFRKCCVRTKWMFHCNEMLQLLWPEVYPVDTRCRFDVYKTSLWLRRRCIDIL